MTEDIRRAVAAERRDQAELLAGLTEEQWNAPSLCAGWRVKEVVAHTTRNLGLDAHWCATLTTALANC